METGVHSADLDLARRAAAGHDAARRELVERLLDRVGTVVRCLAAGDRNVDDYAQDAIVEILRSAGSFRGQSALQTWAERIAIRVTMRRIRKQSYRDGIVALDLRQEPVVDDPSAEIELERRRFWGRVEAALATLNPERRAVLTMQLLLGYSVAEIAEITGTRVNTVRDRLAVGRRLLRRAALEDPVLLELAGQKGS